MTRLIVILVKQLRENIPGKMRRKEKKCLKIDINGRAVASIFASNLLLRFK